MAQEFSPNITFLFLNKDDKYDLKIYEGLEIKKISKHVTTFS